MEACDDRSGEKVPVSRGAESQDVNLWGSEGGGILNEMEAQAQE